MMLPQQNQSFANDRQGLLRELSPGPPQLTTPGAQLTTPGANLTTPGAQLTTPGAQLGTPRGPTYDPRGPTYDPGGPRMTRPARCQLRYRGHVLKPIETNKSIRAFRIDGEADG